MSEPLHLDARPIGAQQTVVLGDQEPIHLLVVEDEVGVREPLVLFLLRRSCRVTQAHHAAEARILLDRYKFDLALVDIMMPGEDGFSLCRHIRLEGDLPVLFLTARGDSADRVLGFDTGADDYVVKPFDPKELLARVRAIIRRGRAIPRDLRMADGRIFVFGAWTLKTSQRELISSDGMVVPLSGGEFNILFQLIKRPRVVLTREQLLDLTQGRAATPFDRSIDNHISRLRKKLESDVHYPTYIKTVWGGGYSFGVDVKQL